MCVCVCVCARALCFDLVLDFLSCFSVSFVCPFVIHLFVLVSLAWNQAIPILDMQSLICKHRRTIVDVPSLLLLMCYFVPVVSVR